ncbi:uncharacterized protein AAGF69_008981 [Amazona ochrocephala]
MVSHTSEADVGGLSRVDGTRRPSPPAFLIAPVPSALLLSYTACKYSKTLESGTATVAAGVGGRCWQGIPPRNSIQLVGGGVVWRRAPLAAAILCPEFVSNGGRGYALWFGPAREVLVAAARCSRTGSGPERRFGAAWRRAGSGSRQRQQQVTHGLKGVQIKSKGCLCQGRCPGFFLQQGVVRMKKEKRKRRMKRRRAAWPTWAEMDGQPEKEVPDPEHQEVRGDQ